MLISVFQKQGLWFKAHVFDHTKKQQSNKQRFPHYSGVWTVWNFIFYFFVVFVGPVVFFGSRSSALPSMSRKSLSPSISCFKTSAYLKTLPVFHVCSPHFVCRAAELRADGFAQASWLAAPLDFCPLETAVIRVRAAELVNMSLLHSKQRGLFYQVEISRGTVESSAIDGLRL